MQRLRTVTLLDVSAVAGHHAMPAALLFSFNIYIKAHKSTKFLPINISKVVESQRFVNINKIRKENRRKIND